MQGSIFPDGVTIDQVALRRTETTKADEILRNRMDWTSRGMFTGGEITVNAVDDTRIDVAQLSGFAPSGEFIETTSDYYSIVLDSYVLNDVNLVIAVYTESLVKSQPHESDGFTYPTASEMAWRIRVYSQANYDALANTDKNLANDAKDRCLVIGKVTANGPAVALTASNVQGPVAFDNILYATPSTLVNISGVTVMSVSSDTPVGNGSLQYDFVMGNHEFEWTSSTGGTGPAVPTNVDGIYNVEDGAGAYIRILVNVSQLPAAVPVIETIVITNLYYQDIPRLTAEDLLHRNFRGTGIVSPVNPHGSSLEDIAGESLPYLEEHQDVMHCNGIWRGSSVSIFTTTINTLPPVADTLIVQPPIAGDLFYVNGKKLTTIDSSASPGTSTIPFDPWQAAWGDILRTGFFEIYVDDIGTLYAHRKASYPAARTVQGTWIVDMSRDYPAGAYSLDYTVIGLNTWFTWAGGLPVAIVTASLTDRVIRLYAENAVDWIDLWINGNVAPSPADDTLSTIPPVNDTIDVVASPDLNQNMQVASLNYWYDTATATGQLGYAPYDPVRRVIEKRQWGNLCKENMADSALQDIVYLPEDELHYSGVLLRRNGYFNEFQQSNMGLVVDIAGGSYYCRGQRLTAMGDSLTLIDTTTNLVWLDMDGNYNVIDVVADFAGELSLAMQYVLGSSVLVPEIDDDTHSTDDMDPPERGVCLYVFKTAAGAVDWSEEVMRNVNGPVDPWSVAHRASASNADKDAYLSAFNSLYSVFAYADVALVKPYSQAHIDVKIVGKSWINRVIEQPINVHVYGVLSDEAEVQLSHADTDGVWRLSDGCTVRDVQVKSWNDATALFLIYGNNTIENCIFSSGVKILNSFVSVYEAVWSPANVDNIKILRNKVLFDGKFFDNFNGASTYNNFVVDDNDILASSPNGTVVSFETVGINNAITNNKIMTNDHASLWVESIYLKDQKQANVSNNYIVVGDGDPLGPEIGIKLKTCANCVVSSNKIEKGTISTSVVGRSIYIENCSVLNICENQLLLANGVINSSGLGDDSLAVTVSENICNTEKTGIYLWGTQCIISNNSIISHGSGIVIQSIQDIKVNDNVLTITTEHASAYASSSTLTVASVGILVLDDSESFSINDNDVRLIGDATVLLTDSYAIAVSESSRFTIQSCKTIADFASMSAGNTGAHICVYLNAVVGKNYTIKDCHMDNRTLTSIPSLIHGLYVSDTTGAGAVAVGAIDSNFIDGSNNNIDPNWELYVNTSGAWLLVKDNCIAAVASVNVPTYSLPGVRDIPSGDNQLINSGGGAGVF